MSPQIDIPVLTTEKKIRPEQLPDIPVEQIDGVSQTGKDILTAGDAAGVRAAIGAGTSDLTLGTTAGTALAGDTPLPSTAADVGAVPTSRKVNGKELSQDIALTAADVAARPSSWVPTAAETGAVPTSRKVNGKELSQDIALTSTDVGARSAGWIPTAAEVGARPSTWMPTAEDVGALSASRKINGKELSQDITLTAADVGARPSTWTPTASEVGAVPNTRTVNGKPLTADIALTAADVAARPSTWTPTAADVGAVPTSRTVNGKALSANISLTAGDVGALDASQNLADLPDVWAAYENLELYENLGNAAWRDVAVWRDETSSRHSLVSNGDPRFLGVTRKIIPDDNYTIQLGDGGKLLEFTSASPVTVTVPYGTIDLDQAIEIAQYGTGQVTLVAQRVGGVDMTLRTSGSLKTRGQYSSIFIRGRHFAEAVVSGDMA